MIPPVLCYHKVERRRELGITRLSPRRFAAQIGAFVRAGWRGISLAEFRATITGERVPRTKEVLLTFDDAYRGLREYAFPLLRDVGFPATCFVITDFAGRLNRWDVAYGGRRFAHLSWRDIESWSGWGIAFESHTATHPRLSWASDQELREEMARSRRAIEMALGAAPTAIAYPFGAADDRVTTAAADSGYALGFSLSGRWTGNALYIPRLPVHCWSSALPGLGPLGGIERCLSAAASRCSIGTTLLRRLTLTMRDGRDGLSPGWHIRRNIS